MTYSPDMYITIDKMHKHLADLGWTPWPWDGSMEAWWKKDGKIVLHVQIVDDFSIEVTNLVTGIVVKKIIQSPKVWEVENADLDLMEIFYVLLAATKPSAMKPVRHLFQHTK